MTMTERFASPLMIKNSNSPFDPVNKNKPLLLKTNDQVLISMLASQNIPNIDKTTFKTTMATLEKFPIILKYTLNHHAKLTLL